MHRRRTHADTHRARPRFGKGQIGKTAPRVMPRQLAHLQCPHRRKSFPTISRYGSFIHYNEPKERNMPRPDPSACDADALIDAVITREGSYVNHHANRRGPTTWGIPAAAPPPHGTTSPLRALPHPP